MQIWQKRPPAEDGLKAGRRRWVASGVMALGCLAGWSSHAAAEDTLPRRNLLVEWRMAGQTQGQQRNQSVQNGQVILDSSGRTIGRTTIGQGTLETENQSNSDDVQQLRVLNGSRAKLYVGHTQPYTVWQWAWTGQAAGAQSGAASGQSSGQGNAPVQVVPQTVWIDIGQGLNVRPRWAGGRAPVIIELEAQSREPARAGSVTTGQYDPDGQSQRFEVSSTLSVPMGQWSVVARSGNHARPQASGTLSTRELDVGDSEQLEIRVTAP